MQCKIFILRSLIRDLNAAADFAEIDHRHNFQLCNTQILVYLLWHTGYCALFRIPESFDVLLFF